MISPKDIRIILIGHSHGTNVMTNATNFLFLKKNFSNKNLTEKNSFYLHNEKILIKLNIKKRIETFEEPFYCKIFL